MDGGKVGMYRQRIANKRLVLTKPARRSFSICARHKSWVVVFASFCRLGRWHGRTSEALAFFVAR